ncbi:TolC family protein [Propionispira raffinosivorans]|uniref:TolC family protein n=1 Tax=Propionispira raffinosivorans TaxID=86959 RepID=UPI0003810F69|nr:TolC family protein [Propionispira raffinosivorans]
MLKKKITTICLFGLFMGCSIHGFAAEHENTLNLNECIDKALKQNQQINMAAHGLEAAKWQLAEMKGAREFSLNFSHTSSKIGGEYWSVYHIENVPSSYFTNSFSASMPIYTGGRIEGGIDQAKLGVEISDLGLQNTRQQIKYQVTQSYYMILACQNYEDAKAEAVKQLQEHLKNVNEQFAVGVVARADILRSEVALANAQQEFVTAKNNTKIAKSSFNKLLGNPVQNDVSITNDMQYIQCDYVLDDCIAYAFEHRPDYCAAQKEILQAKDEMKIVAAGDKPNVALIGTYGTYDTKFNEFDTKEWQAGINISLNIFDGNVTKAKTKEASAKLAQAEAGVKDETASVEFEVQQAYLNMRKAESNITTNKAAVAKAQEDFVLAGARYSVNLGTNLDVVDAQVALTNAKNLYIGSLYDYNVSKAALERAMGKF